MITSAAAIVICVFGAFVLGDLRVLRVFGLGTAAAILLDATLVRMVLMLSILQIMGPMSWWLPTPLERLLPRGTEWAVVRDERTTVPEVD